MSERWIATTLSGVSESVDYGYTESASSKKVGPKFLRITDIQKGVVNWDDVPYCPINAQDHQKYKLKVGDIVVARTGNSTGENYLLRSEVDAVFASYLIRFRIDKSKADPDFVWYNLRSPNWWSFIYNSKTGSAQAGANAKVLGQYEFRLPPIKSQRSIAHILRSFDQKIELNRKMNETLEAMARATFKSWFIDFDPVRAKMDGRWKKGQSLPGLPESLFDLTPEVFEQLGEQLIPKGWITSGLSDLSQLNPEVWAKSNRPSVIRYVDLSGTKWGQIESIAQYNAEDAPSRAQRVLRYGDTIIGTVRPGNGSYSLVAKEGLTGSTGFAVLRPSKPEYIEFIYLAATSMDNIERLAHLADGAAYPAVSSEIVWRTPCVYSQRAIELFSTYIRPTLFKIAANHSQNDLLANLRETLLPQLISGQLQIQNLDRFLKENGV